ncbi:hypothetical protein ACFL2D_02210 [Patescibacteria group bacterium]
MPPVGPMAGQSSPQQQKQQQQQQQKQQQQQQGGGMSGQIQKGQLSKQGMQASKQRQLLNQYMQQQQQQAAPAAPQKDAGLLSRIFGTPKSAQTDAKRAQEMKDQPTGLFGMLGFGSKTPAQDESYSTRQAAAYKTYENSAAEVKRIEDNIGYNQTQLASSSSQQDKSLYEGLIADDQVKLKGAQDRSQSDYLKYKYMK